MLTHPINMRLISLTREFDQRLRADSGRLTASSARRSGTERDRGRLASTFEPVGGCRENLKEGEDGLWLATSAREHHLISSVIGS